MESHTLDLYPNRGPVHMALFRKVTNAPDLRQRLIAQDQSLSYALIDASLILNPFHALLAVNRAVHDEQNNQLKSHNINSEIVIELSPNAVTRTQIAQSLRRFGISDNSQNLLVIKVGGEAGDVQQDMINNIKGELVPLSELDQMHDIKSIQKYYQLGNQESDPQQMLPLVTGAMALKGL
ncbi:CGI-121-domain-containing protein [Lichtheimia hyalospora FSU 10163]|nr:CGI-121-domain-containing protein [Lichtheimia hyalospora FSU 10163]